MSEQAKKLEAALLETLLEDAGAHDSELATQLTGDPHGRVDVVTYGDVGILTTDKGLVLRWRDEDGDSFEAQLTIVVSNYR